jgi:hypothetical protein
VAWLLCVCLAGMGIAMRRRLPADAVARHRRPLIVLLIAALAATLLLAARPTLDAGNGLRGEYFRNLTWTGPPEFSAVDPAPSVGVMKQRWNRIPPGQFSVRWTGFLTVGTSGLYTFTTTSDDGSQLTIDNRLVVDNDGMHGVTTQTGRIQLDRGSHVVVLRYVQFGAAYELRWSMALDGEADAPIPAWALSQRPTSYATVVNARILEWGWRSFAVVALLATLWYLRVGLEGSGKRIAWRVNALGQDVSTPYRNLPALVFSVLILFVIFVPGRYSGYQLSVRTVESTSRQLNASVVRALGNLEAFQADINNPQTGEHALSRRVQEALTMLRRHGVDRYRVSDSITRDPWRFRQIVATAWPRKLDKDASALLVLNSEPLAPGCSVIEKQRDVSLVYCP